MSKNALSKIGFCQSSIDSINHGEYSIDLNTYLIKNPEATFLLRFQGDSMKNVGIFDGDIIVVDRSIRPQYGDLVIIHLNGSFRIKRLVKEGEDPSFEADDSEGLELWGTVSNVIHKL